MKTHLPLCLQARNATNYKETPNPDYDYVLAYVGSQDPGRVYLDDPQGLFGGNGNSGESFTGKGKVAYLYAFASPEITAPEVVGVNRDDDDGNGTSDWEDTGLVPGEDDLAEVRVRVAEPPGVSGTVTVTPLVSHGTLWKDRGKAAAVDWRDVIAIPASGTVEATYYLEGYAASPRHRSDRIEVAVQCGSSSMTTSHVFTVVDRVAEPITTERSGGQIVNPCCAVTGAAVPLKVDVLPHDFPDAEIKWRVVSGGGSFSGGGTGRMVQFTASGGEGALSTVQVDVGDCPGPAPQLELLLTAMHEVRIYPCVIEGTETASPITAPVLASMLGEVNAIYRQVGLHFSLGAPITNIVNDTWASDGLVSTAVGAQIRNVMSNTGGLEVYFIAGNGADTEPSGSQTSYGIIVKNSSNAKTLAHEIGHACGWGDIYIRRGATGPILSELYGSVNQAWMPGDWSGGGAGGFYETNLRQYEVIPRLLMYGVRNDDKADIPSGSVYGLTKAGDLGSVNVGRGGFFSPSPVSQ